MRTERRSPAPPARDLRARVRSLRGFTLVELLLTIVIVSLIIGLGLGSIARMNLGDQVALPQLQSTLRSARNWAVAQNAPASVHIDAASRTVRADGLRVLGTWRFEKGSLDGAFGVTGAKLGGRTLERGFRGNALSFSGEPPRSRVEFPVQTDPGCVLTHGFRIALALRADEDAAGEVFALGESLGLETTGAGAIKAWIVTQTVDAFGAEARGARSIVQAPAGTLRAERWHELAFSYDGHELELEVDGTLVGLTNCESPVARAEGPLVLSPSAQPWQGAIDDLVFAVVQAGDPVRIPDRVAFAKGTPREIRFTAGGGLDRTRHSEPVTLTLELEDGRQQHTTVNLFGTVE